MEGMPFTSLQACPCSHFLQLNATEAHLTMAATTHPDSLFWSFASSTNVGNIPPDTPETQALGNGSLTPNGGVNQRLVPFLQNMTGKRLGIVMFDCESYYLRGCKHHR